MPKTQFHTYVFLNKNNKPTLSFQIKQLRSESENEREGEAYQDLLLISNFVK